MLSQRERFVLFIPLILVMLPLLVWPAISGLFLSFTNYAPGQVDVHWVGLGNLLAVLHNPTFQSSWRNVLVLTAVCVPADLALGFALAYLLREPFRGRGLVRVLFLIPWLVSPIGNGVMWYFLLNLQVGMLNFGLSWLGLTMIPSPLGLTGLALLTTSATYIWHDASLAGFLLLPGLASIPDADWDYATLEGASLADRIFRIALPRLRPLLLVVGLFLTGNTLGAFDTILILTGGGPGSATFTPALYSYQQAFQVSAWPLAATSAWLIVISVLGVGAGYLWLVRKEAMEW